MIRRPADPIPRSAAALPEPARSSDPLESEGQPSSSSFASDLPLVPVLEAARLQHRLGRTLDQTPRGSVPATIIASTVALGAGVGAGLRVGLAPERSAADFASHVFDPNRPLNRIPMVMMHNAGSEPGEGSVPGLASSQTLPIKDILDTTPVRAFELDLHKHAGQIVVNHGGFYMPGQTPTTFDTHLEGIKHWLDQPEHKDEFVVLMLETHLGFDNRQAAMSSLERVLGDRLFRPADSPYRAELENWARFGGGPVAPWLQQAPDSDWPTASALVAKGQQVMVISDSTAVVDADPGRWLDDFLARPGGAGLSGLVGLINAPGGVGEKIGAPASSPAGDPGGAAGARIAIGKLVGVAGLGGSLPASGAAPPPASAGESELGSIIGAWLGGRRLGGLQDMIDAPRSGGGLEVAADALKQGLLASPTVAPAPGSDERALRDEIFRLIGSRWGGLPGGDFIPPEDVPADGIDKLPVFYKPFTDFAFGRRDVWEDRTLVGRVVGKLAPEWHPTFDTRDVDAMAQHPGFIKLDELTANDPRLLTPAARGTLSQIEVSAFDGVFFPGAAARAIVFGTGAALATGSLAFGLAGSVLRAAHHERLIGRARDALGAQVLALDVADVVDAQPAADGVEAIDARVVIARARERLMKEITFSTAQAGVNGTLAASGALALAGAMLPPFLAALSASSLGSMALGLSATAASTFLNRRRLGLALDGAARSRTMRALVDAKTGKLEAARLDPDAEKKHAARRAQTALEQNGRNLLWAGWLARIGGSAKTHLPNVARASWLTAGSALLASGLVDAALAHRRRRAELAQPFHLASQALLGSVHSRAVPFFGRSSFERFIDQHRDHLVSALGMPAGASRREISKALAEPRHQRLRDELELSCRAGEIGSLLERADQGQAETTKALRGKLVEEISGAAGRDVRNRALMGALKTTSVMWSAALMLPAMAHVLLLLAAGAVLVGGSLALGLAGRERRLFRRQLDAAIGEQGTSESPATRLSRERYLKLEASLLDAAQRNDGLPLGDIEAPTSRPMPAAF